ncbi:MAG: restriction endonuclease subunit S [Faecalibacterium prausnitzii]
MIVTLKDITTKITKGTTPTSIGCKFEKSGINFIKSESLVDGKTIDKSKFAFISERTHERLKRSQIEENDILFSMAGMFLGKTGIATAEVVPANTNQAVAIIRVDDTKANYEYVYYYLNQKSVIHTINTTSAQSAQPNINLKQIGKIKINLPNRKKQDQIVSLLSAIDLKISNNVEINDNLFAQMQALYAAWFIDCIPFGGIKPSSWQKTSIYTIADIIYGAPFSSKQFNTDGKGIPIIRIRDLKEQKVATYTTEKHPKGYLLQAGDIVVGMDGEFVPYIWGSDEAWLNQRVCVFKNKRLKGKAFLYFTIKPLLYAIEQTQVATTVIHIGKKDFDAFEITLPDPRVLDSFDAITTPMVEKIVENRFEIKQLELLRDALLPKLMSGELDVSNIQL